LRTTVSWKSLQTLCAIVARGWPGSEAVGSVSSSGTISAQLKMGVPVAGKRSVTLTALAAPVPLPVTLPVLHVTSSRKSVSSPPAESSPVNAMVCVPALSVTVVEKACQLLVLVGVK